MGGCTGDLMSLLFGFDYFLLKDVQLTASCTLYFVSVWRRESRFAEQFTAVLTTDFVKTRVHLWHLRYRRLRAELYAFQPCVRYNIPLNRDMPVQRQGTYCTFGMLI